MARYRFYMDDSDNEGRQYVTEVNFHAETYDEVVQWFDQFLKGAGFIYEGELEIVNHRKEAKTCECCKNTDGLY